jgi:L-asparaginase
MTVALFTLGGTIAMAGRGDAPGGTAGVVARLTAADLVSAVPQLAGVPLDVHDVHAVPSADLTFGQVLAVVDAADAAVGRGATGVVVTQGTDTLEECAYLVDLVWPHPEPFVLTGAMRNPTLAGPDGPANLLAAVRVAAAPAARDLGALVLLDDQVHAARFVRKAHSTATGAFTSPDTGPIGHVVEGAARILVTPPRHAAMRPPDPAALDACRVALHTCTLDDDGMALAGLAGTHQGLVVAGYGVGHVPGRLAPVLGELATRIPVVLASRTGAGPVLTGTYGAIGSETDLLRRGLIGAGLLHPYRARVLLRLLLAAGADRDGIAAAFAQHG